MRAAMTGHLGITTVHTEDAISAIDRLRDMGVPSYLIAAGLRGVISQRLLRRICPSCKQEIVPPKKALELAGLRIFRVRNTGRAQAATSASAPATGDESAYLKL